MLTRFKGRKTIDAGYFYVPYNSTIMKPSSKNRKNYGPTHNQIQKRAFQLWQEAGKPEHGDSDHFWKLAEKELVPQVQKAIELELPNWIVVKLSDDPAWPFSYRYHDKFWSKDKNGNRRFAEGRLHDNGKYELCVNANMLEPSCNEMSRLASIIEYDLNDQESLEKLLQQIVICGTHAINNDKAAIGKIAKASGGFALGPKVGGINKKSLAVMKKVFQRNKSTQ